jgi:isopentenyldiphosphate isomerase
MIQNDELFDIVDDRDRVIGQAPRSACHGNPALVHRVAHVLVVNGRGELLLQKRSANKDIQPGKWDTSVGGHLDPGEDYLTAARREMAEEIGVSGVPLIFLYHSQMRNAIESENIATFLACYDGPLQANPNEIDELRFWTAVEIAAACGDGRLTPNFEQEWELFCAWQQRYPVNPDAPLALCAGDNSLVLQQRLQDEL